jgi:hypothetical protein
MGLTADEVQLRAMVVESVVAAVTTLFNLWIISRVIWIHFIPCKEQRKLPDQLRSTDYIWRKVTE